MKTSTVIKKLKEKFPGIQGIKPGKEWYGDDNDNSIFLGDAAEGGTIDGVMPAADYNLCTGSYKNFGVHAKLDKALEKMGFYSEWYDCGTLFAYRI